MAILHLSDSDAGRSFEINVNDRIQIDFSVRSSCGQKCELMVVGKEFLELYGHQKGSSNLSSIGGSMIHEKYDYFARSPGTCRISWKFSTPSERNSSRIRKEVEIQIHK